MKVLILGGTSDTGKCIIDKALSKGHEVVVYARSLQKLDEETAKKIKVFKGELTDESDLLEALDEVDTVISVVGPTPGHPSTLPVANGYKVIIKCMKEKNVRRLIALSTSSSVDENDKFSLPTTLGITMVKLFLKSAYNDVVEYGKVIKSSDVDWTLFHVGFLTNGEETTVKIGCIGDTSLVISRKNIAKFCIDELENNQFIKKAPSDEKFLLY